MAEAETSDAKLAIAVESEYGVNPESGAKFFRLTSESLKQNQGRVVSEEVTGDRNPRQSIRTSVDSGGAVNFEFSGNNFDDLIAGAMMADFPAVPTIIATDIAAVAATQKFTAASGLDGIVKGQWFRTADFTDPANNGRFRAAADSTATEITAEPGSGIVDESSAARRIQPSQMIRPGSTLKSFTFERQWTDISVFEQFNGQVVESLDLSMAQEQVITGTANFVGKDAAAPTTSSAMGTIAAAGTEQIAATVEALRGVREGSLAADTALRLTELSLSFSNATRLKRDAASLTPFDVGLGIIVVEVTASFYLANKDLIDKYRGNTLTPFSWRIEGPGATDPDYIFTAPSMRINDLDDPISGNSADGFINATLMAETDADGVAFQIDKLPAI